MALEKKFEVATSRKLSGERFGSPLGSSAAVDPAPSPTARVRPAVHHDALAMRHTQSRNVGLYGQCPERLL